MKYITDFYHLDSVKTSEIEMIGLGLFGKSWQAQIAYHLRSRSTGKTLSRNTLYSWHDRDNLPFKHKATLRKLALARLQQVRQAFNMLNDDALSIEVAIADFLDKNSNRLSPDAIIYTRLFFGYDKYRNLILKPEIEFNKKDEEKSAGWKGFNFSAGSFMHELVNLKQNLLEHFLKQEAAYDSQLDMPNSTNYRFDEMNFRYITSIKHEPIAIKNLRK